MDAETKKKIRAAQKQLLEGQVWTRRDPPTGGVWPEIVVVAERASVLFGAVLTMAVRPASKVGHAFPIRADLLVDAYELTYDPIHENGVLQNRLEDCKMALLAIHKDTASSAIKATIESVLKFHFEGEDKAETLEEAIKVAESILAGSSDPA